MFCPSCQTTAAIAAFNPRGPTATAGPSKGGCRSAAQSEAAIEAERAVAGVPASLGKIRAVPSLAPSVWHDPSLLHPPIQAVLPVVTDEQRIHVARIKVARTFWRGSQTRQNVTSALLVDARSHRDRSPTGTADCSTHPTGRGSPRPHSDSFRCRLLQQVATLCPLSTAPCCLAWALRLRYAQASGPAVWEREYA